MRSKKHQPRLWQRKKSSPQVENEARWNHLEEFYSSAMAAKKLFISAN
jgi:hypothetical protein